MTEEPELAPEVKERIEERANRLEAYRRGEYELDDNEGFYCPECGWRGLIAPMAEDWSAKNAVECAECGSTEVDTGGIQDEKENS